MAKKKCKPYLDQLADLQAEVAQKAAQEAIQKAIQRVNDSLVVDGIGKSETKEVTDDKDCDPSGEGEIVVDNQAPKPQKDNAENLPEVKGGRQPLTHKARLVRDKLESLRDGEAMTRKEILDWLGKLPDPIYMDEGTFNKIRKELIPYGLKNKKRVGYYLQEITL